MRLILGQLDCTVGAVEVNRERLRQAWSDARLSPDDLLICPELALAGYPPEDLLLRPGFLRRCANELNTLQQQTAGGHLLIGHPWAEKDRLYNAASWWCDGSTQLRYRKQALPNYAVFDEKRYFQRGTVPAVGRWGEVKVGVLICEDIWEEMPARAAVHAGADLLVVINASPFHVGKRARREALLSARAREHGVAIAYVNLVGGQDDLIFDGQSTVVNSDGHIVAVAPAFTEGLYEIEYDPARRQFVRPDWHVDEKRSDLELVYDGIVRATGDYVRKNGFSKVLLGLSGGIDSALTLAIAADALGPENVDAVLLPSRYTSDMSNEEAARQAEMLGVRWRSIPIEQPFQAFLAELEAHFEGRAPDITEENLQSRCRGVILMALSNKLGSLLLSTGNKSEMAVGYATLYGDMCGAFAPLKDLYKTEVYQIAALRNRYSAAIPQAVIDRPPSAELRDNQVDQDSLPPYEVLDGILYRFIEQEMSRPEIIADGFDEATVRKVAAQVLRNEYKRRQAPPGPRVSTRAFGRERRYPISSGYR